MVRGSTHKIIEKRPNLKLRGREVDMVGGLNLSRIDTTI